MKAEPFDAVELTLTGPWIRPAKDPRCPDLSRYRVAGERARSEDLPNLA